MHPPATAVLGSQHAHGCRPTAKGLLSAISAGALTTLHAQAQQQVPAHMQHQ